MKIITGYTGTKHITPADDAGLHRSMFGSEDYVLAAGSQLAAQAESSTEIRIADGELVMQGRHARNASGYEAVAIANGTQGMRRNDLIVARYSIDASTSVESINLVAIKGTAASGNATDPAYNVGDIDNGETRDFPLYRVRLNGVNIEGVDQLFKVVRSAETLGDHIVAVEADLKTTKDSVNKSLSGKAPTSHSHAMSDLTGSLPVSKGGTGATTVAAARKNLGLGNTSGSLPIANGGTGATDRADAISNLLVLPTNTVPSEDTSSAWEDMGFCKIFFNTSSTVINKPTDYGTLLNFVNETVGVVQLWFRHGYGDMFVRAGNATGWNNGNAESGADAWKPVYTSANIVPIENGGTGASNAEAARDALGITDELGSLRNSIESKINMTSAELQALQIKITNLEKIVNDLNNGK